MIELRDISKSFGGQELFRDCCFSIGSNEKIGLVGRNGHGKTTLFGLINSTLSADSGTIVIPKNYRIGNLEQNINFSQDTLLSEVCLGLSERERGQLWKAEKVSHGLGFSTADFKRPPSEFSSGFQVRINLAKILVSEANLLLLDEPNNYLDVVAIRWLIRFLRHWRGELMLITHDRCFMDAVITHIVGIHRRRMRKIKGTTKKFYDQIALEEEIHEKTRLRDHRKRKQSEIFISKFRAKARQAGLVQSRLKNIAKMEKLEKLETIKTFNISFNSASFGAATMMDVNNLSFSYDGAMPKLFENISFRIGRRERLCVTGKNGKGKSTLLKILAGELSPVNGTVKLHPGLAKGYYSQTNVAKLSAQRTVLDEIMSADPAGLPQRVRSICGALLFSQDLALKPISVLSGGEKSRVLMGKVLMQPCHLLLLDEPTNHLDLESTQALCLAIEEFEGSVIMVTHNEFLLNRIAENILVFDDNGARYFHGTYQEFLIKVGWEDEEASLKSEPENIKNNTFVMDKKTRKRLIAQLRCEKSRVLKPLEKQIKDFEKKISYLEAELRRTNEELVSASYQADASAIAKLAKANKELPRQIDANYSGLDAELQKYEAFCKEFSQKLADLSGYN